MPSPISGKEIWSHELTEGLASFRGVTYWPGEGNTPARIFFTSLKKLVALNALTDLGQGNLESRINRRPCLVPWRDLLARRRQHAGSYFLYQFEETGRSQCPHRSRARKSGVTN